MYSNFRDGGTSEMADKVEHLIQQLASGFSWTRSNACKELGALGDVRAFEPLLQRLGDEDSYVRAAASEALGKLGFGAEAQLLSEALGAKTKAVEQLRARIAGGEERLWRPLLAALADSEAHRAAVSRLLGALGDVRAFEPLLQRLGDEDSDVRAAASEALGKLGFRAEAQLLSEALGAKTKAVKQLRARIAGGEERWWRPLLAMLEDTQADRAAVCRLLGTLGDVRALEPLMQRLGDGYSGVRAAACKALGNLGDVRAVEPLIQRLGDNDGDVCAAACEALGKLGFGTEAQMVSAALEGEAQAVAQLRARVAGGEERLQCLLLEALEDENTRLLEVSSLLGALGDVRVLELLIRLAQERAADVELTCEALAIVCKALGESGDVRVVGPLITVLEAIPEISACNWNIERPEAHGDVYHELATVVCEALVALDHPCVVESLMELVSAGSEIASAVCHALAKLGATDKVELYTLLLRESLPVIVTLDCYDPHAFWACSEACHVLGSLGDVRAVEPLLQVVQELGDTGPFWDEGGENLYSTVLYAACMALVELGDARAVNPLIELLHYDDWEVALAACDAVIELGDVRAVDPLIQRLADKSEQVRTLACRALGKLGDARAANAIIQLTLQEKDPKVLEAAQEALNRLLPAPQQGESS